MNEARAAEERRGGEAGRTPGRDPGRKQGNGDERAAEQEDGDKDRMVDNRRNTPCEEQRRALHPRH